MTDSPNLKAYEEWIEEARKHIYNSVDNAYEEISTNDHVDFADDPDSVLIPVTEELHFACRQEAMRRFVQDIISEQEA